MANCGLLTWLKLLKLQTLKVAVAGWLTDWLTDMIEILNLLHRLTNSYLQNNCKYLSYLSESKVQVIIKQNKIPPKANNPPNNPPLTYVVY